MPSATPKTRVTTFCLVSLLASALESSRIRFHLWKHLLWAISGNFIHSSMLYATGGFRGVLYNRKHSDFYPAWLQNSHPISSSTAGVSSSCPIRGIRKETFQVQANLQTRPLRALSSKKTLCKGVWPPCHHSVEVNLSHHKQQQFVFHYQIKSQAAKEHSTGALYLSRLYGKGYF